MTPQASFQLRVLILSRRGPITASLRFLPKEKSTSEARRLSFFYPSPSSAHVLCLFFLLYSHFSFIEDVRATVDITSELLLFVELRQEWRQKIIRFNYGQLQLLF
jgi:hypothetical protein